MTPKEAVAALAASKTTEIVEISKDLKPQVQAQMLRAITSNTQRLLRAKNVVVAVTTQ